MKVPLRLKRSLEPGGSADAFLFRADNFTPLMHARAILLNARLFRVSVGFLLLPSEATCAVVPGAIRLRRLGGDFFIPHDAILIPSLLPDEMAALTRDRGLVVLPDRSILGFDLHSPLPASRWLAAARTERSLWEPLPAPPELANELTRIEHPSPPAAVLEILTAGEPDEADRMPGSGESPSGVPREQDRPAGGSTLGRVGATMGLAAGGVLAWLGRNLAMPKLAQAGANLARRAVEAVPRMTERVFGEQEAALRNVLRDLQDGNVERALRRAPPAFADPDAPSRVDTGGSLGSRDPRYSLRDLIGGGVQSGWLGGGDVWAKLAEEYRRLAREAAARGDFRRAAYLHGMLLRDYRAAANALLAGGLHRDAAILLRDKVKDDLAAAKAFDQAADYDEALRLYDRNGRHEEAGDLLKRLDDLPRARERYLQAADVHAARSHWHAAGDLICRKLADRSEACRYFRAGWNAGNADSLPCGRRLFAELLEAREWEQSRELVEDAAARYRPPRSGDCREFFHHAIRAARGTMPPDPFDDLKDRTRLLFAEHLRPAREQGLGEKLSGDLFAQIAVWPPAVARDAAFAARTPRQKDAEFPAPPPVEIASGTVRAVAFAKAVRAVVVATDEALTIWSEARGCICISGLEGRTVLGLAVDPEAKCVFLLSSAGNIVRLSCFTENAGLWSHASQFHFREPAEESWHLEPCVSLHDSEYRVTVATPTRREMFQGTLLLDRDPVGYQRTGSNTHLLAFPGPHFWDWDDRFIRCLDEKGEVLLRWVPHWTPAVPPGSSLAVPPLDWSSPTANSLEIAGIDADGILHWSRYQPDESVTSQTFDTDGEKFRFRAACLSTHGTVIGATDDNRLVWVRSRMMVELKIANDVLRLSPAGIAALFWDVRVNQALVVFEDGRVVPIRDWR